MAYAFAFLAGLTILAICVWGRSLVMDHAGAAHRQAISPARMEAWQQAADQLGLEYTPLPDPGEVAYLNVFPFFSVGEGQVMRHSLHGETDDSEVRLLEYSYQTGLDSTLTRWSQTVICFSSRDMEVPCFRIASERIGGPLTPPKETLAGLIDPQTMQLPFCRETARGLVLRGVNRDATNAFFSDAMLEHVGQHANLCVEGHGFMLLFYRVNNVAPASLIRDCFAEAYALFMLIKQRSQAVARETEAVLAD